MIKNVEHKAFLFLLKIIPMVSALIYFIGMVEILFTGESQIFNIFGHISFVPLSFLYLSSAVFKFCFCHRMFLHYISIINIYNAIDVYYTFRILTLNFFITIMIITFVFMVIILHEYMKYMKRYDKKKGGNLWR